MQTETQTTQPVQTVQSATPGAAPQVETQAPAVEPTTAENILSADELAKQVKELKTKLSQRDEPPSEYHYDAIDAIMKKENNPELENFAKQVLNEQWANQMAGLGLTQKQFDAAAVETLNNALRQVSQNKQQSLQQQSIEEEQYQIQRKHFFGEMSDRELMGRIAQHNVISDGFDVIDPKGDSLQEIYLKLQKGPSGMPTVNVKRETQFNNAADALLSKYDLTLDMEPKKWSKAITKIYGENINDAQALTTLRERLIAKL